MKTPATLYQLLPQPRPAAVIGCWEDAIRPFTHIVGYSYLGHFFLHDAASGDFAVLYPFRQAYKNYGTFASVTDFEQAVLQDAGFQSFVLLPRHQAAIAELLGVPGTDEIYIPTPYPLLGGTEGPDTYQTGDVWVFAEFVGQCHGLS